jgi:hypothetical protein
VSKHSYWRRLSIVEALDLAKIVIRLFCTASPIY